MHTQAEVYPAHCLLLLSIIVVASHLNTAPHEHPEEPPDHTHTVLRGDAIGTSVVASAQTWMLTQVYIHADPFCKRTLMSVRIKHLLDASWEPIRPHLPAPVPLLQLL